MPASHKHQVARQKNKDRIQWYVIIVATLVLASFTINSLTKGTEVPHDVYLFFGTMAGLVLGAGVVNKMKK